MKKVKTVMKNYSTMTGIIRKSLSCIFYSGIGIYRRPGGDFQSGLDISMSQGDKFSVVSFCISMGSGVRLSMLVSISGCFSSVESCPVLFSLSSSIGSVNKTKL